MLENQMKICFITQAQFNLIWTKMMPPERFQPDIPTLAMMGKRVNTLFIVGEQKDFIFDNPASLIPEQWLKNDIERGAFGLPPIDPNNSVANP